jgi:hypothetical protein
MTRANRAKRRRDGAEVVVASRTCFEQTRPSLKSTLLALRFGTRGDAVDQALATAGEALGGALSISGARTVRT